MTRPYLIRHWVPLSMGAAVVLAAGASMVRAVAEMPPSESAAATPPHFSPEQIVHSTKMTMGCVTRELEQTAGEHLQAGEKSLALRMVDDGQCWLFDETTPLRVAHVEPGMSQVFVLYPSGREPVVWIPNKMLR